LAPFIVTSQGCVTPVHAPVHPTKIWPASGVAVSATSMPSANHPVQLTVPPAHVIPAGFDVTVPAAVPPMITVSGSVRVAAVATLTE
jgi:hypothetical protein